MVKQDDKVGMKKKPNINPSNFSSLELILGY